MSAFDRWVPARTRGPVFFLCCVLVGVGLQASERVARAWGLDAECYAEVWGELVEVRQVAGSGAIDGQAWPQQALVDLIGGTLGLFDDRPAEATYEELAVEREEAP